MPESPQQPELSSALDGLARPDGEPSHLPDAIDDQIATLQARLQEVDNKLHEERFLWMLAVIVILDFYFLLPAENWAGPIVIGILQLFGLIVIASRCRVDPIMPILDKITGMFPGRNSL